MEALAGKLYNAVCPFWIVHAAPIKLNCVPSGIKTSNLIVRGKDFFRGQDACCSGGGMSPKVPVLRGRRARKNDCLEFLSNDVLLHVRKQLGTVSLLVVPDTEVKQTLAINPPPFLWS